MTIRRAAVAGTFYPSDPDVLAGEIRGYLGAVQAPEPSFSVRMLVVPHAGYIYSGLTAAAGYKCLEHMSVRRVVMLGPSHYVPFAGLALPGAEELETPLGMVAVDTVAAEELLGDSLVTESAPAHRQEHSLEVQLPFLQVVCPGVPVVPLLTGAISPRQGVDVVGPLLDEDTLLLISSDLSHYYDYSTARRLDAATAEAITRLDGAGLDRESACGRTGIQIALELATRSGCRVQVLDLRNSGDTAGPRDRVVGYGAFAIGT